MNHISVKASNILSIGYDKAARILEVRFRKGARVTYPDVAEHIYFKFLIAPNKDDFFKAHLAYGPEQNAGQTSSVQMPSRNAHLKSKAEQSWLRVRDYLPTQAHKFIKTILDENPTDVFPVKMRLRRHGDYQCRCSGGVHKITVNKGGNPYQFALTLIHELAHARAYIDNGPRIRAHGSEWRVTFTAFLQRSLTAKCFPEDLVSAVEDFSYSPTATTSNDLEEALRPYDTMDKRPLVSELPYGTLFSQGNGYILHKGSLRDGYFRCEAFDGTTYRVPVGSRVFATYLIRDGQLEVLSDYMALTQIQIEESEAREHHELWTGDAGMACPSIEPEHDESPEDYLSDDGGSTESQ